MENNIDRAKHWLSLSNGESFLNEQEQCQTRDIFQARLDKIRITLESQPNSQLEVIYPLVAVIGEIGNNAYDHNLGKWRDAMGIYFFADVENQTVVIADRGQGILSSIQKVKPEIKTDIDAIKVAFTETISGRSPEKRGNGLKFVTKVARDLGLNIFLQSGFASTKINNSQLQFGEETENINGVLAVIKYILWLLSN